MNQPNLTIAKYAQIYFDLGWNIIPLFDFSKNPASATKVLPHGGWLELQKRRITKAELKLFFTKNNPTGIGVITGKISGIVVLDEDSYKEGGMRVELSSPLVSKTASGGRHLFFKYVDPIKTTGLKKGVFIETKSDGGFIVLSPSVVINKQGEKGKYEWINARVSSMKNLPTITENQLSIYVGMDGEKKKMHEVLNAEPGTKHENLRTFALMIFNRFKQNEWDIAENVIRDENKKLNPPHDHADTERIIRDARKFVLENPKEEERITPKSELRIYSGSEADTLYSEKQKQFGDGITTGYVKLDEYFKFLPEQVYMLSAATHIGKTTFALNMAARVANLGHVVLFASLEQGVYIVPRVKSILTVDKMPESFSIVDTDGFPSAKDFITMIDGMEKKPEILFIDHLHYFARGNRGATEEIDRIVVEIQVMAKKLKIPILLISHVRKLNDSKMPTMDDMKDSVSLSQIPAVVMLLSREKIDTDLLLDGQSIYAKEGFLLINKNRIQGKTGMLKIRVEDSGIINFI